MDSGANIHLVTIILYFKPVGIDRSLRHHPIDPLKNGKVRRCNPVSPACSCICRFEVAVKEQNDMPDPQPAPGIVFLVGVNRSQCSLEVRMGRGLQYKSDGFRPR